MYECKAVKGGVYRPPVYSVVVDSSLESIWKDQKECLRKKRSVYASVRLYKLDAASSVIREDREISSQETLIIVPNRGSLRVPSLGLVLSAVLTGDGVRYMFDKDLLYDTTSV